MTVAVLVYRTAAIGRFYPAAIELSRRDSIAGKLRTKHICKKSCNYYIANGSFVILFLKTALFFFKIAL